MVSRIILQHSVTGDNRGNVSIAGLLLTPTTIQSWVRMVKHCLQTQKLVFQRHAIDFDAFDINEWTKSVSVI